MKNRVKYVKSLITDLGNKKTFPIFCFTVTSFYFFSRIFFGLDFTDSFYHLNQALNPADNIYLYPFFLSSLIIKLLVKIAGPEIIYLRIINSSLLYLSFLFPFFINKVSIFRTRNLYSLSIILILFAPFNVNILGYDTLSIFMLSLIFSLTIFYFKTNQTYILYILSVISAAAVLIRIPNILVVPFLILAIGFAEKINSGYFSSKNLTHILGYVLLTSLCIYLGYFWYYSNFEEFLQASANATSHDLKNLFYNYFVDGVHLLSFIFVILFGFFLQKKLSDKVPSFLLYGLLGFFWFIFLFNFVALTKYSQKYSFLLSALAISFSLFQIFKNGNKLFNRNNFILYLFLIFLFINPFGSNTGLLKATSLIVLFPFVLSYINFKLDNYWLLILTILIPFSILENLYRTYEDQGLLVLDNRLKNELLSPIFTNEIRSEFLASVDYEVKQLKKENFKVFFYGDKSHVFHYLYPESALNINSFFQPLNDLVYYTSLNQVVNENEKVVVFLIDSYPETDSNTQSVIGTELENDGFRKVITKTLTYYLKMQQN